MNDVSLSEMRESIDEIDRQIVSLLARRFAVTEEIGHLKKRQRLPSRDPQREERQKQSLRTLSLEHGLNPDIAEDFFDVIVRHVVSRHDAIKGQPE